MFDKEAISMANIRTFKTLELLKDFKSLKSFKLLKAFLKLAMK